MMEISVDEKDYVSAPGIYKITNKVNGKVYIGQTVNLRKRISDYRNTDKKEQKGMYRYMNMIGSEHFKFEVIRQCSESELNDLENKYIHDYDSCNPNKGYNFVKYNSILQNSAFSRMAKSAAHIGLKETAVTKRKKSNAIIAIKGKEMILSDSGKLFGDYVGKSKDMIKTGLRQPCVVCGYDLFYDDYHKREEIRRKVLAKEYNKKSGYLELSEFLNKREQEGVETIYLYFNVYQLSYDHIDKEGKPIKLSVSEL